MERSGGREEELSFSLSDVRMTREGRNKERGVDKNWLRDKNLQNLNSS